jgi:hypothetical protein
MKAYFVQLTNHIFDKNQVLLSGAVLAESKEEAEKKAIEAASNYIQIKEKNIRLSLYTIIELTDERSIQFRIEMGE